MQRLTSERIPRQVEKSSLLKVVAHNSTNRPYEGEARQLLREVAQASALAT
jgi:hypothetical protein